VSCSGEEWKGSRRSSWGNRGRAVGGRFSQSWLGGGWLELRELSATGKALF